MTRAMDMRGDPRSVVRQRFSAGMSLGALCLALSMAAPAEAARQGHGRIVSAPGKPLEVAIHEVDLTDADVAALKASVAPAANWAQFGLTPPVAVESLRVSIAPGTSPSSRTLVVTSAQPVDQPVVDILLDVVTASGSGPLQVSFLVPTRASAGGSGGSVVVAKGDTLFSIAQHNAVAGTTLYQMLWALYQANPQAFIHENMNFLRMGATVTIPDADTVRAVDPKYAQQMFTQHQEAYRKLRGAGAPTAAAPARVSPGVTQSGPVTQAPGVLPANSGNQVRVTAASPEEQKQDAKVAAAKELAEIQSRVDALQENVKQLKEALGNQVEGAAGPSGAQGAQGAQGAAGAAGSAGRAGSTGAAGVAGAAGAPGAPASATATGSSGSAASGSGSNAGSGSGAASSATASGLSTATARLDSVTSVLANNILFVITGVLALCAFVIAWMMRRAGTRRDDENEDIDAASDPGPAATAAFEHKMQSIDLNLGDAPVVPKPGNPIPKAENPLPKA